MAPENFIAFIALVCANKLFQTSPCALPSSKERLTLSRKMKPPKSKKGGSQRRSTVRQETDSLEKPKTTNSRFATFNPFILLDQEDTPQDQQDVHRHSFFTSFPGEIRNSIYDHLLSVPKASQIFAQELFLDTDDRPNLRTALLTEHLDVQYLFHLAISCKKGGEEISPILSQGISNSSILQVRLDIGILAGNYHFCLMEALRERDENSWLKRILDQTIRIIWPEDNIELFYFGASRFLYGLPAPRRLQMEVKGGPWMSVRNGVPLKTEDCDFVLSRRCSLLHRSGGIIEAGDVRISTFERDEGYQGNNTYLGSHLRFVLLISSCYCPVGRLTCSSFREAHCLRWLRKRGRYNALQEYWDELRSSPEMGQTWVEENRQDDGDYVNDSGEICTREEIKNWERRWYADDPSVYK